MALEELIPVLERRPGDPEAGYIKAKILVDEQRFSEALPLLKNALAGVPSNLPHVHALFGKVYAAQGRTREAIEEYKQALAADRRGTYHYQLYRLYIKTGDKDNAAAMLVKVWSGPLK